MKLSIRSILLLGTVLLLPIVLILNFFVYQKSQEETYVQAIEKKIHAVEASFNEDYELFRRLGSTQDSLSFDRMSQEGYTFPFFIVDAQKQLRYWSSNQFIIDFSALDLKQKFQVIESPYGTFLVKLQKIGPKEGSDFFVQAFRLVWAGNIKNDDVVMGPNPEVFGNSLFTLYPKPADGTFQVKSTSGLPLFGLDFKMGFVSVGKTWTTPLLIFSVSLFLLYGFLSFIFLRKKWKKGQVWQAVGYGFFILVLVRVGMLIFDFPQDYLDLSIFDSANYRSSWLVPSLGDLFLHTACSVLILGLLIYQLSAKPILEKFASWRQRVREEVFLVLTLLISTLFFIGLWMVVRDLVLNATWNLDISSIPSFNRMVGISYMVIFLWAAIYVFLSFALLNLFIRGGSARQLMLRVVGIVAVLGSVIFFALNFWFGLAGMIHFLFLFSIIRFDLVANVYRLGLETFLTLFYASLIAAGIVAASSYQSAADRLVQTKLVFANQQLLASEERTVSILEDVFSRLKNDLFIQNRLADPLLSKDPVLSKIRKIYLDNYFDQFEVMIRIFSPSGKLIGGPIEGGSLQALQEEFVKSDYATSVPNLYLVQNSGSGKGKKFVAFIPMNKAGIGLATLYLEFDQLRIQAGNAYPRLLLDEQYAEKLKTDPFNFGVFKEGELIRSSGTFNYQQEEIRLLLQNPNLVSAGVEALGYQHLGILNGEELWVLSSPTSSIKRFFETFSLFFVVFVFLTFASILGSVLMQGYRRFEFNYSTKLQLYLNFAFFFPILIISIITTGLLSQSYTDDLNAQYIQKASLIKGNLVRFFGGQNLEDVDRDALTEEINALATTVGTDIHLYDNRGDLLTSSRTAIFEKKLLSNRMHPGAMAALVEANEVEVILEEQIGKLKYQAVYLVIPSQSNSSINAVVAIPFFESEEELNSLISDVLGNVFNTFVVIFILFLIISFLVTKNLTLPFRLLTQKLKVTNLENNEPMYWSSKDEIGLLVNEYNLMLSKLEASKKVLASTEKESAWREMAKQVAHEIKNPLTPMKLTLQHLLRLEKEGKLEDADKLKKSLETLIHQVDALSGIASSFSTFAKMPLPNNELMNFKEVLLRVVELFKTDKRMVLEFQDDSFTDQISILGDDKLFGRVISNLIINGMQAVAAGTKPQIRIWLWLTDRAVFLEISDNGKGIPVELRDKIFIPNFSTKSQGSGLGLAIAKSGVETAGGKIWFETEVGKGTTFFLTFPLAKR